MENRGGEKGASMSTGLTETPRGLLGPPGRIWSWWKRRRLRWKTAVVGLLLGAFAAGLWTAPVAWLALQGGHTQTAVNYAIITAGGLAVAVIGGYLMGIRMERNLDGTDRAWTGSPGEGYGEWAGTRMSTGEARYILVPTAFGAMTEAQALTDTLEDNLADLNRGAANVRPELVEIFSELVNNAAEHGVTEGSASAIAHVRFMPHRRGSAFDVVVVDEGPGIRETLARNPGLIVPDTDADAILLATQELVSGTGDPTRGIGLWMTVTEMRKPGRKLLIHSCAGLFTMYGVNESEIREIGHRQGVVVRLTIPA